MANVQKLLVEAETVNDFLACWINPHTLQLAEWEGLTSKDGSVNFIERLEIGAIPAYNSEYIPIYDGAPGSEYVYIFDGEGTNPRNVRRINWSSFRIYVTLWDAWRDYRRDVMPIPSNGECEEWELAARHTYAEIARRRITCREFSRLAGVGHYENGKEYKIVPKDCYLLAAYPETDENNMVECYGLTLLDKVKDCQTSKK